jgi:hypothetical protein
VQHVGWRARQPAACRSRPAPAASAGEHDPGREHDEEQGDRDDGHTVGDDWFEVNITSASYLGDGKFCFVGTVVAATGSFSGYVNASRATTVLDGGSSGAGVDKFGGSWGNTCPEAKHFVTSGNLTVHGG